MSEISETTKTPPPLDTLALIGLGANLEEPRAQIERALTLIEESGTADVIAVSDCFESDPVGRLDQPVFVNAVALVSSNLPSAELMALLLDVESTMGRTRSPFEKNGPRLIDLDLLVHGIDISVSPDLLLPHPRAAERGFVLYPLKNLFDAASYPMQIALTDLIMGNFKRGLPTLIDALAEPAGAVRLIPASAPKNVSG